MFESLCRPVQQNLFLTKIKDHFHELKIFSDTMPWNTKVNILKAERKKSLPNY
jgi:hypothetical protein